MSKANYSAKVTDSSRELTGKEKVMLKDTSDAISLNEAVKDGALIINPLLWAEVSVHNETADNVDYDVFIVVDKDGTKYKTSSTSFVSTFKDILEDMDGTDEEYSIKVYTKPSKNSAYQGFITCSVI